MGGVLDAWDRAVPVPLWVVGFGALALWALWPRERGQSSGLLRLLVLLALALGAVYLAATWMAGV